MYSLFNEYRCNRWPVSRAFITLGWTEWWSMLMGSDPIWSLLQLRSLSGHWASSEPSMALIRVNLNAIHCRRQNSSYVRQNSSVQSWTALKVTFGSAFLSDKKCYDICLTTLLTLFLSLLSTETTNAEWSLCEWAQVVKKSTERSANTHLSLFFSLLCALLAQENCGQDWDESDPH